MSLTLRQWLIVAAAAPDILEALPPARPLIDRMLKLADDLKAAANEGGQPIAPKDLVERSHGLSADEQRIFDRHGPE